MSNKYYDWWKTHKPMMALFPAIVFWFSSMLFFMVGLRFDNPMMVFGTDVSTMIAVSLTIANTFIQIIGNEMEPEGLGTALWIGWIASYVLGIGTNIVGLREVLAIDNTNLEWMIAFGLGTLIEVMPERLLVLFLKTWSGTKRQAKPSPKPFYRPDNPNMSNLPKKSPPQPPWETGRPKPKHQPAHFPVKHPFEE